MKMRKALATQEGRDDSNVLKRGFLTFQLRSGVLILCRVLSMTTITNKSSIKYLEWISHHKQFILVLPSVVLNQLSYSVQLVNKWLSNQPTFVIKTALKNSGLFTKPSTKRNRKKNRRKKATSIQYIP